MIRGLYTAGWSMLADTRMMDVISNNLANVNTNAYKKDSVIFQTFPDALTERINDTRSKTNPTGNIGSMQMGFDAGEVYTYYTQGQLVGTNNSSDMAIQGADNAFFTVQVPDANGNMTQYYTRDGAFELNSSKQLVTKDGYLVLGENGPITLNNGDFTVNDDGSVVQNGQLIDKLMIKQFTDTKTLRKYGDNLVSSTSDSQEEPFTGTIKQGYIEQSNVNIVREMVDMISVMRAYEASQKVVQAEDSTLDKTVNQVGAIR
ncbi:MAG: flagellar hook-basal body protein [Bacillota bacterium]|nr:flagellar hook-basal body protein [Bacillota bacterium]